MVKTLDWWDFHALWDGQVFPCRVGPSTDSLSLDHPYQQWEGDSVDRYNLLVGETELLILDCYIPFVWELPALPFRRLPVFS